MAPLCYYLCLSKTKGFGRMEYADLGSGLSAYTGWFVNGFRHGEGRCFFHKTGEEYEGEWACDEPMDLRVFQHNGPLVEGSGGEEVVADCIECPLGTPPTSLDIKNDTQDKPKSRGRRSSLGTELNSSMASACSADTDESIALSSMEDRTIANNSPPNAIPQALRRSIDRRSLPTESDNLSLSIKSLSVFDYSTEQGLRLYRYQNGDIFKGRLDRENKRQGSGVYTEHRMGAVYNGDWRDSKRHGVGHLRLASGAEYSGEFFEDKIHGQGSLTLIDGTVYTVSLALVCYFMLLQSRSLAYFWTEHSPWHRTTQLYLEYRAPCSTASFTAEECSRMNPITGYTLANSRTANVPARARRPFPMVPATRASTSVASAMAAGRSSIPPDQSSTPATGTKICVTARDGCHNIVMGSPQMGKRGATRAISSRTNSRVMGDTRMRIGRASRDSGSTTSQGTGIGPSRTQTAQNFMVSLRFGIRTRRGLLRQMDRIHRGG